MKRPSIHISIFMLAIYMLWGALYLLQPAAAQAQVAPTRNLLMGCNSCHFIHGGGSFLLDPSASDTQTLCLSCHGAGNPLGLPVKNVHTNNAQTQTVTCRICHNPHYNYPTGRDPADSDTWYQANPDFWLNKKLIGTRLSGVGEVDAVSGNTIPTGVAVYATPPANSSNNADDWNPPSPRQVVFGIRPVNVINNKNPTIVQSDWASNENSPDVPVGFHQGTCDNCHTLTEHHPNFDPSAADHDHNLTKMCTNCHDHAQGFRKGN